MQMGCGRKPKAVVSLLAKDLPKCILLAKCIPVNTYCKTIWGIRTPALRKTFGECFLAVTEGFFKAHTSITLSCLEKFKSKSRFSQDTINRGLNPALRISTVLGVIYRFKLAQYGLVVFRITTLLYIMLFITEFIIRHILLFCNELCVKPSNTLTAPPNYSFEVLFIKGRRGIPVPQ